MRENVTDWGRIAAADGWEGIEHGDLFDAALAGIAWQLIEQTMDTADREPSAAVYREATVTAERILRTRAHRHDRETTAEEADRA